MIHAVRELCFPGGNFPKQILQGEGAMINGISKRILILSVCFFAFAPFAFSQESLPHGYSKISLGMSVDEVKEALKSNAQFGYRGERDVSLLPGENRTLIETDTSRTAPYSYLDRCWFQFHDGKLYVMTINLNQDKLDHYSVFSSLCEKYGEPTTLTPQKSEWVSDSVIVDLERPLAIKYTDRAVMTSLIDAASVQDTAAEMNRAQFLEGL